MKHKNIIFLSMVFMTMVGCGRVNQGDEGIVNPELSFENFTTYFGTKVASEEEIEESVYTPPFEDENQLEPSDDKNIENALQWTPNGSYLNRITKKCHYSEIEKILSQPLTVRNLSSEAQLWINNCEKELSKFNNQKFKVLLDYALVKYPLHENKDISSVKINLDNGYTVRGLLGLKRDGKSRPLILVQAGVHSNADEGASSKNVFMQLFDESPFNILFVGSVTGSDFMKDNGLLTLGGLDEGQNLLKLAKLVKSEDSPFRDLISEVHVLGISLGGHGALYSSLYNSYQAEKPIKSVMAYCPVENLEPTLDSVFDESVRGWYYNFLTVKLFRKVYDRVPILRELLERGENWTREMMKAVVKTAAFRHYNKKSQSKDWTYAPFNELKIESPDELWSASNFIEKTNEITTPTAVVFSDDDYLVLPKINSRDLASKLTKEPNDNIGVIKFSYGNHCAASIANGWPTLSSLFRHYFISQSNFSEELRQSKIFEIEKIVSKKGVFNQKLKSKNIQTKAVFTAEKNKNSFKLSLSIFDPARDRNCRFARPLEAGKECYKDVIVQLSLSALQSLGVRIPSSDFETQKLTRWLNTHVELLSENNENILGSNKWPRYLKVNGRGDH